MANQKTRDFLREISKTDAKTLAEINLIIIKKDMTYLSENTINVAVADAIVRSQDAKTIKRLLQTGNILSDWAQKRIFHEASKDIVNMLLTRQQPLTSELEETLLMQNDGDLVCRYTSHHRFSEKNELLMLKTKSVKIIEHYIENHSMGRFSQIELLKYPKMLKKYVSKHSLCVEALKEMMTEYQYNDIEDLIFSKKAHGDEELLLQRYGREQLIENYWLKFGFINPTEAVSVLLKREMNDLVAQIIRNNDNLKLHSDEILQSASTQVREAYIESNELSDEQQIAVMEKGEAKEIKLMIRNNHICSIAQHMILTRSVLAEIVMLLESQTVSKELQSTIISRGNHAEILALCGTQTLTKEAEDLLLKRGDDDEILVYVDRRPLKSISLLMEKKSYLVNYYTLRHILSNEQFKEFVEKANEEQIEVYRDFYYPED